MLPKSERLRSNRQFQQVFKKGQSFAEGLVVLHFVRVPEDEGRHVGFSVSKKVGNAVVRNRVKRRLRAIVHGLSPRLVPGHDAVVVARARAATAEFGMLERALTKAFDRAGLLTP